MAGGFKTFNAGDVLTAADAMAYWMRQVIAQVTSGTRPSSPATGQPIDESDTLRWRRYDGTNWRLYGPPAGIYSRVQRTAGNVVTTSATWADVDTGTDITLAAVAGDLIQITADIYWSVGSGGSGFIDFRCVASGTYFGSAVETNTGTGVVGIGTPALAGVAGTNGTVYRSVVSGDISGGNVVIRGRFKSTAGSTQLINAVTAGPYTVVGRNLGPNT